MASDVNLLRQHDISHVLNLASIVENRFPSSFTYKKLDLLDLPETRITDHFPECFDFIDRSELRCTPGAQDPGLGPDLPKCCFPEVIALSVQRSFVLLRSKFL